MGVLLIRCPATGHEFSTGIQVGADTLARVPQEFTHTIALLQSRAFMAAPRGQARRGNPAG